MLGSQVLDIGIGLILVFLLVSIVLTAVQEAIEAWFRSRAADLNGAIHELLQKDEGMVQALYQHPLVFALHRAGVGATFARADVASPAGWSPWSPAWRQVRKARADLPSYIPRETFAAALLDLLKTDGVGTSDGSQRILTAYKALDRLSGGDVSRVHVEIGNWYDGAMDRASGWFKRRTQKTLFWLGLASALALNLNAITIAQHLATDQQARQYVTRYAEGIVAQGQPDLDALHTTLQDEIGLPIGWSDATRKQMAAPPGGFGTLIWLVTLLIGYLITAFAAMLGAPFWFDVLNRVMVIRSTVKPKEKSPDEPSQDGGRDANRASVAGDTPAPVTAPATP